MRLDLNLTINPLNCRSARTVAPNRGLAIAFTRSGFIIQPQLREWECRHIKHRRPSVFALSSGRLILPFTPHTSITPVYKSYDISVNFLVDDDAEA